MYEEGNEEIAKLFEEKIDEKFGNVYDNNDFINMNIEVRQQTNNFNEFFRSKTTLYT